MPRKTGSTNKQPRECGTPAAFVRHKRHDEDPCQPCRDAYNAYQRARQKAARDRLRRRKKGREAPQ